MNQKLWEPLAWFIYWSLLNNKIYCITIAKQLHRDPLIFRPFKLTENYETKITSYVVIGQIKNRKLRSFLGCLNRKLRGPALARDVHDLEHQKLRCTTSYSPALGYFYGGSENRYNWLKTKNLLKYLINYQILKMRPKFLFAVPHIFFWKFFGHYITSSKYFKKSKDTYIFMWPMVYAIINN